MAFYTRPWFWVLLLAIIFILVGIIGFETTRPTTPWWIWLFFFIGILMIPVSAVIGYLSYHHATIKIHHQSDFETVPTPRIKSPAIPDSATPVAVPAGSAIVQGKDGQHYIVKK